MTALTAPLLKAAPLATQQSRISSRFPLAALALFIGLAFLAAPVQAQDLQSQIERLQRELSDLQSFVYRNGSGGGSSGSAQPLPPGSAADIQVRLGELETSLRQLRGQIEEMNYRIRQNSDRLERFMADAEYRLTVLEGGDPGSPPPSAAAPAAGGQASQQPATGAAAVSSGGVATNSATVGSLGQVSENSVAAVQQRGTGSVAGDQGAVQQQPVTQSAPQTAAAAPSGAVTLPEGSPEEQYGFALGLLRQTRFDDAQVALDSFLAQNPDHSLAPNAKYWLGETYYVRADYQNAAVTFAEGFQQFPQGSKAPDNLLKLGMSLGQLGDKQNACATFAQLQQRFPNAPSNIQQKAQLERQRLGC